MAKVRCFLAIEITPSILKKIGDILNDLRSSPGDVKWVKPDNIHLTLKFFGNIETRNIDEICSRVEMAVAQKKSFRVGVSGMGAFPNSRSPRVIWLGLEDREGKLASIYRKVEEKLEIIGFKSEKRPFKPHLTIGRVKSQRGKKELFKVIDNFSTLDLGSFEVKSLVLFKSDLTPKGAIYTKLNTMNFS